MNSFKKPLILCLLWGGIGVLGLISGPIHYFGFEILYPWANIGIICFCLLGCFLCLKGIWKHLNNPQGSMVMTDEQYAQAKADLDRMYFREHGVMPEWPEQEEEKEEDKKDPM